MRRPTRASREYQRVKDRMRFDNAALAYMHTKTGKAWFLVPSSGQEVSEIVAQRILGDEDIVPSNDGLLPGVTQCYRIRKECSGMSATVQDQYICQCGKAYVVDTDCHTGDVWWVEISPHPEQEPRTECPACAPDKNWGEPANPGDVITITSEMLKPPR
jgi:hypothetical protein